MSRFPTPVATPTAEPRRNRFGDVVEPPTLNRFGDPIESAPTEQPRRGGRFNAIVADEERSGSRFGARLVESDEPTAPVSKSPHRFGAMAVPVAEAEPVASVETTEFPPAAKPVNRLAKLQELHNRIKSEGETPELLAEREAERTRLQAEYENENRNFITKSLPVRAVESAAKNMKRGNELVVSQGTRAVAHLLGRDELRDSMKGVGQRVLNDLGSDAFIQGELDKNSYVGTTAAGWTRQATEMIGDAYLFGGGRSGLVRMASYYAAKTASEEAANGKGFAEAATQGVIEGAATLAGGKLLGTGTGALAGTGRKGATTAADKAAAYLVQKSRRKISQSLTEISTAAGADVLTEMGTEAAHYLTSVGFGEEFNAKTLSDRMLSVVGPALLAGGGGKALQTASNRFAHGIGKVRADLNKLPNSPNSEKTIEAAEALPDPPADEEIDQSATTIPNDTNAAVDMDVPGETIPTPAATDDASIIPQSEPAVVTSARREDVDHDRELLGLNAIDDPATRTWQTAIDTAKANGTPKRALDLANSIIEKPRALSDVETAGIVVKAAELKNEHAERIRQLNETSDPTDLAVRSAELNRIENDFDVLSQSLRMSGTEKGRALASQKLTINADYDLVSTLSRAKAAKGEGLTPEQRTKFEELSGKAQIAQQRLKAHDEQQATREQQNQHREVARIRSAVGSIRKQLGLDATTVADAAVPGLSDENKATLATLNQKLKAAEQALQQLETMPATERVHNRPSEKPVSDLDDEITRIRADIRRKSRLIEKDSTVEEKRKIDALEKKLGEAQETLRKARAGEPIPARVVSRADVPSQQRQELTYELDKTRREIRDAINGLKPKGIWHHAQTLTDLSLGLLTSIDYSAIGRQAKYAAWSHPIIAAKALPSMFKAGWSDRHAFDIEQEILSRSNAPLYDLGMTIHRRDAKLADREEQFVSKILEKQFTVRGRNIPNPVAGSQRAYVAFLNRMRADTFDALAKIHGGDMGLTHAEYKQLGHLINVNTGRGGFAAADKHMRTAALAFWAPRFAIARIQYALGQPGWHSTNKVRKIVAQEYARSFIGAAIWYGLFTAAWGDDERFSLTFDPRSIDFGKIVLGDTRLDPLAGMAQWGRFAARMLSGQKVDQYGRVKEMSGYDKWHEVSRFTRSKLSPIVGQGANLLVGEDVMGNPVNVTSAEGVSNLAGGLVIPLSLRDVKAAMEDQGVPRGTVLSILNLFGDSMQVYDNGKR
jgi:hypothetical protein